MGILDRIRDTVVTNTMDPAGTPNLARRSAQMGSMIADTVADHSTTAAWAVSGISAAAVVAEGALTSYVYPPGDYAGFDTEKGR